MRKKKRQKAVASETAQAEASLALECDVRQTANALNPPLNRRADSWTANRKQTACRQKCSVGEPKAKCGFVGGRWAHVGGAGKRGAGNLRIVSIDKTRPRSAVDADLGIVATKPFSAPPASFWEAAKSYRASPRWSWPTAR